MTYFKYPRTYHLSYSLSKTDDDKTLSSDEHFYQMESVVITEKMDGENTTIYPNGYCHARSIDSKHAEYHSWLLNEIQNWCYSIGENRRVCGEYLYAQHTIHYNDLKTYFYGFSLWERSKCLDWETTISEFNRLKIEPVPLLYMGKYSADKVKEIFKSVVVDNGGEGIVIRNAGEFYIDAFSENVAKCVRANHVQTDAHWTKQEIKINGLKGCKNG